MSLYFDDKKVVAILAGNGLLPVLLASYLFKKQKKFQLVVFESFNKALIKYKPIFSDIQKPVELIAKLKLLNVNKLIFAGSFSRVNLQDEPITHGDKGFRQIISKNYQAGDDKLLREVAKFFEDYGFKILGAHQVLEDLIEIENRVLSNNQPNELNKDDAIVAEKILHQISKFDLGQSVIIRNGMCMGIETSTGTDHMIESYGNYMKNTQSNLKKSGGILFKACKEGQDRRFDLPTIGIETIKLAYKVGLDGLVVERGGVIYLEKEKVIKLANELKIFVWSRCVSV